MFEEHRIRLSDNLRSVQQRIGATCARAGRSLDEVTLVAVTKYARIEWLRELKKLGVNDFGEARPQQLSQRARDLPNEVRWHLIGHLQRNKAEEMTTLTHLIHSVDSVRLFDHLAKLAKPLARPKRILLEINISGEASKDGFPCDELLSVWPMLRICPSVEIAGLMTMAPQSENADEARSVFERLREFRNRLVSDSDRRWPLEELSMGMSGDFEIAIEEGATIVRIGSSLFEGLTE